MSNKGISQSLATRQKISLANTKDRTELLEKIGGYIDGLKDNQFPSITACALHAGIGEKALLAYELRTAENSDIRIMLDIIRDRQKEYLTINGLNKTNDSRMSILLLKANHGLKEEPTALTQNNSFNVSAEILAEALELSRGKK